VKSDGVVVVWRAVRFMLCQLWVGLVVAMTAATALALDDDGSVAAGEGGELAAVVSGRPLIIAHRGASAYLPEHTLEAYQLALDLGADCIESDLVSTRDGHLVVRHDNLLNLTTDVADRPEFAGRRREKEVDGKALEGWFSEDFSVDELLSLRARERIPDLREDSARADGRYSVVSLAQVLAFIRVQEQSRGRQICFYPEIKHPYYFDNLGLAMEEALVDALHQAGYTRRSDPVYIQSFEVAALKKLRKLTDLKLLQLLGRRGGPWDEVVSGGDLSYRDMATPEGLAAIARYADVLGPPKYFSMISADYLLRPNPQKIRKLVQSAHAAGLQVNPYTFRGENHFLPLYWRNGWSRANRGDLLAEALLFLDAGVDGLFIDNPEIGVAAAKIWACGAGVGCQEALVPAAISLP
jgi:glycerophosphoryl diester phosphodiesterase